MLNIELDHTENGLTICRPVGELGRVHGEPVPADAGRTGLEPPPADRHVGGAVRRLRRPRALIGGIRRARELGGDVAVACNRPTLTRLLRTTGFDRIVTVAETIEEAAAALLPCETRTRTTTTARTTITASA